MPAICRMIRLRFAASAQKGKRYTEYDFEDLCSRSSLKLIEHLSSDDRGKITDIASYSAVVASNVWNEFLAEQSPHRRSLKNKIRYAIGKSPLVEMWNVDGETRVAAAGQTSHSSAKTTDDLAELVERDVAGFRSLGLSDLVCEVISRADGSMRLADLVTIVARLTMVDDLEDVPLDGYWQDKIAVDANTHEQMELRDRLKYIWSEIEKLPPNQRTALLYNLRDDNGREMLFVFFNSRAASLRQIAEAMALTVDEFSLTLPLLPFDDKTIGDRMGLTAKQVANLRKVARENLRRRMDGKPKRRRNGPAAGGVK